MMKLSLKAGICMMEKSLFDSRFKDIEENYKELSFAISDAAVKYCRSPQEIRFMAVTKTVEPKYINHALSLGLNLIGENRVQEFLGKRDELNLQGIEKHLIGHLQTNKVKQIVGNVDFIDGVDSVKLAQEIGKYSQKIDVVTPILLEVNIGSEESKFGFTPENVMEAVHEIAEIQGIRINGLMAIPPFSTDSLKNRVFFENMQRIFIDISAKKLDNVNMGILSMGMSGDFTDAIACGSTMVRIGSALFGARNYR